MYITLITNKYKLIKSQINICKFVCNLKKYLQQRIAVNKIDSLKDERMFLSVNCNDFS